MAVSHQRLLRRLSWAGLALVGACAQSGQGGCGSDYPYPRNDSAAKPTPQALRARITDTGLASLTRGLPAVIAASCSSTDPNAACAVDDPLSPTQVKFFLGSPGNEVTFGTTLAGVPAQGSLRAGGTYPLDTEFEGADVNIFSTSAIERRSYCDDTGGSACAEVLSRGTGTSGSGFCRTGCSNSTAATDYCCGDAAPHLCAGEYNIDTCTAPKSSIALHLASLVGNLHMSLIPPADGGGVRVIIGCPASDLSTCAAGEYVRGSADLVAVLSADVPVEGQIDFACSIKDNPTENAAFQIRTFRFNAKPRIELGTDGRPHLVVTRDDITVDVDGTQIDFFDVQESAAMSDPACYDEGWDVTGGSSNNFSDCTTWCPGIPNNLMSTLMSDTLGEVLASMVAQLVLEQFGDTPLDVVGPLDLAGLTDFVSHRAKTVSYLAAANVDSPEVTGNTGALGLNFDLDTGFAADPSPCVPRRTAPAWTALAAPDPGATVMAPNPVTGVLESEPFDAALIVSDTAINRAAFSLFDGGGLCLSLTAQAIGDVSGGAFTPTVGALSLVAPGLAGFAPADAPVDLAIAPTEPPTITFGTGEGEGAQRDSHLKVRWPGVHIDLYPLLDEAPTRVLGVSADVSVGISALPTPTGSVQLFIDSLDIQNLAETYNEMGAAFDPDGLNQLLGVFLPALLDGEPIDLPLDSSTLGIPLVPKLRAVSLLGAAGHHLGVFARLCTADDLTDSQNALCYEAPGTLNPLSVRSLPSKNLWAQPVGGNVLLAEEPLVVQAHSGVGPIELAIRVDGLGPYFTFVAADEDGLFHLEHPALAWPGDHTVELLGRAQSNPSSWTEPSRFTVHVERIPSPLLPESTGVPVAPAAVAAPAPTPRQKAPSGGCNAAAGGLLSALFALASLVALRRRF